MGSDLSKDITPPPLTLQDCLVDGALNVNRYWYYRRRLDDHTQSFESHNCGRNNNTKRKHANLVSVTKRAPRSVKKHKTLVRDVGGHLQ